MTSKRIELTMWSEALLWEVVLCYVLRCLLAIIYREHGHEQCIKNPEDQCLNPILNSIDFRRILMNSLSRCFMVSLENGVIAIH